MGPLPSKRAQSESLSLRFVATDLDVFRKMLEEFPAVFVRQERR